MASQETWKDHSALLGEEVPGWLTIGLLSLGGVSIMLALWLLFLPPDSYPALGPAWTTSPQEKEDGVSPASVTDRPIVKAVEAMATEEKSVGGSETLADKRASAASADNDPAQQRLASLKTTASQAAPPQFGKNPALQLANPSVKSGSVRRQPCSPFFIVLFEHNSVTPVVTDRQVEIAYLRDWLHSHPQTKVILEGYTDALGSEEYNLLLSYRRAKAVATVLAEAGLPSDRLVVRAFGAQRPLTDRAATSVEQRRVSVRTNGSNECPGLH